MDVRLERRPAPPPLNAWKCWNCGGVLAKIHLLPGCAVEIKCAKCRAMNTAALEPKPSIVVAPR